MKKSIYDPNNYNLQWTLFQHPEKKNIIPVK